MKCGAIADKSAPRPATSCGCCGTTESHGSEPTTRDTTLRQYFLIGGIGFFALGFLLPDVGAKAAFLASAFLAGFSVFKAAFVQARSRVFFTMEVLMTLATVGAIFIDQTEEAAAVVVLFGIGQILEEFARY
jgi:cation transport ATPase